MSEQTEISVEDWLKQEIQKYCNKDGCYPIYFTYQDEISEETLLKAYQEYQDSYEKRDGISFGIYLEDYIFEKWDLEEQAQDALLDDIRLDLRFMSDEFNERYEDFADNKTVWEILEAGGYQGAFYDLTDILQSYRINLMLGTANERNMDMGSISSMFDSQPKDYSSADEYAKRAADNALTYLVHQQGYTLPDLFEAMYTESGAAFLTSVISEKNDHTYDMGELTALVELSGADAVKLLDAVANGREGGVTLSPGTTIGIFNEWNGSGSVLEIELEKPASFPISMIRGIQIEGAGGKQNGGYTVDNVYGLIGSCWKEASLTDTAPTITYNLDEEVGRVQELADYYVNGGKAIEEIMGWLDTAPLGSRKEDIELGDKVFVDITRTAQAEADGSLNWGVSVQVYAYRNSYEPIPVAASVKQISDDMLEEKLHEIVKAGGEADKLNASEFSLPLSKKRYEVIQKADADMKKSRNDAGRDL